MKLKDYSKQIAELAKQYPDALVVSAADDEGNSYQKVSYAGTVGFFEGEYHGDFHSLDNVKSDSEYEGYEQFKNKKPNAVCIN
jgi:hypothetical protein